MFNNGEYVISGMTNRNSLQLPVVDGVRREDETGLNCDLLVSRKRVRDSASLLPEMQFTSVGGDVSLEIQRQQLEMDQLVTVHAEGIRLCVQERGDVERRSVLEAVEQSFAKELAERDEKLETIGQLNLSLQEKVKTLRHENLLWKDHAYRNEMKANAMKINLKQMMDQIQLRTQQENQQFRRRHVVSEPNAISFCSTNNGGRRLYEENDPQHRGSAFNRLCRLCGKGESSVLLLPCRHLCVCNCCGSSVQICPICKSNKTGSVNINFSF